MCALPSLNRPTPNPPTIMRAQRTALFALLLLLGMTMRPVSAQTTGAERSPDQTALLIEFGSNLHQLTVLLDGLTLEQYTFRPAEGRWTLQEVAEHIILSETYLLDTIRQQVLGAAPEQDYVPDPAADAQVRSFVRDRSFQAQTTPALEPQGLFETTAAAIQALIERRSTTMAFLQESEANLRAHRLDHPVGQKYDAYQWFLFMVGHADRHLAQMEEIRAHDGYPATF